MNTSIEFCQKCNFGDECREFAGQYPTFADFWANCERSIWMLRLLDVARYRNADKLWEFCGQIQDLENSQSDLPQYQVWLNWDRVKFKKDLSDSIDLGKADQEQLRFWDWIGTHSKAMEVAKGAVGRAISRARWDNLGATDEAARSAMKESLRDEEKKQADMLREIIGNPFLFANNEDFARL